MCNGDAARHFARTLDQIAPRWGVRVPADCQPRQKVLPLEPLDRTFADRLLIAGDAAGIVKSTTGGGIYYSLLTASLAARTLARALDNDELVDGALAEYETAWKDRLGSELRSQLMLRRIAQRLTDSDIDGLFDLARTDGIMPLMRQTAAFNHHREFIVALLKHPPARRLLFKAALG